MNCEILEIDVSDWHISEPVVFDWYDGPKHGVCVLDHMSMEIEFECIAERYNPDGMEHRIFSISQIESGAVAKIRNLLGSDQKNSDRAIDVILCKSRPTGLFVYSFNFVAILHGWRVNIHLENPEVLFDQLEIGAP
jgi:hypothetical protein